MKRKLKNKKLSKAEMAISLWMDDYDSCDIDDAIHEHFENWIKKKKRNTRRVLEWPDVSHEARRVYELLFHEKCGEFSPMTAMLCGVAAAADDLAIHNVAQHLGVSQSAVRGVAYETKGDGDADFFLLECKKLDNER